MKFPSAAKRPEETVFLTFQKLGAFFLRRQYQLLRPRRFLDWYKTCFYKHIILDSMNNLDSCVANQATSKFFCCFNIFRKERPRLTAITHLHRTRRDIAVNVSFNRLHYRYLQLFLLSKHGKPVSPCYMLFGVILHVRRMECKHNHNTLILCSIDKHI